MIADSICETQMGGRGCTPTHAEVRVAQGRAQVPAQAAPALAAQYVRRGGAAEGLKSLPAHLRTELLSVTEKYSKSEHFRSWKQQMLLKGFMD